MQSRSQTLIVVIAIALAAFASGYIMGQSPTAPVTLFGAETLTPDEAKTSFAPFWESWKLLHARFYQQPVSDAVLVNGAIDGLVAAVGDKYTQYLTPEEEANARNEMEGEFEGIGVDIEVVDGLFIVVAPIDGSPAEAAGLLPGDILRKADGIDLEGKSLQDIVLLVRGPAGTPVQLTFERNGEPIKREIVRDLIKTATVRGKLLDNGIAYLRLSRFGNRTMEELDRTLEALLASNPSGLVLDLRGNPGGNLDIAVEVGDQFLGEGVMLIQRFADGRERILSTSSGGLVEDIPLAVLIDRGSASAAEILAGAIQDRQRGLLVGHESFGKGTIQSWYPLSNKGGVQITVAQWLTPNGRWIHEVGLLPDYSIKAGDNKYQVDYVDTQLAAAVDLLLGKPVESEPHDESTPHHQRD